MVTMILDGWPLPTLVLASDCNYKMTELQHQTSSYPNRHLYVPSDEHIGYMINVCNVY